MKKSDTGSDCESEEDDGQLLPQANDVTTHNQLPSQNDGIAEQSTNFPDLVDDEEDNGFMVLLQTRQRL